MKVSSLPLEKIAVKGRGTFSNGPFGSDLVKADLAETGVPVIYIRDIRNARYERVSTTCVNREKANSLSACQVLPGDVLIAKVGDPPGIAAIYPKNEPLGIVTQDVIRLRVDSEVALPEYVRLWINSPRGKHSIKLITVEATRARFSLGDFKALQIPLPPLAEQRRIAAILDKADDIRRKRKQAIQYTEELLRATFLDMFGDPVTNPKGWEIKSLNEVMSLITYGLTVRPKYFKTGIPLVSGTQIRNGIVDLNGAPRISKEDFEKLSDKSKAKAGDIFFAKTGAIGHCAILEVNEEIAIAQNIARLVFKSEQVLPVFALHYLRGGYIQDLAKRQAKGNAVQDLQLGEMKKFPIPVPPIQVQEEFVKACQRIEQLTKRHVSDYDLTENLFNSLLQRAFRGEL